MTASKLGGMAEPDKSEGREAANHRDDRSRRLVSEAENCRLGNGSGGLLRATGVAISTDQP